MAQDDLDVDPRHLRVAQHLDHPGARLGPSRGSQGDDDEGPRRQLVGPLDLEVDGDAGIVGSEPALPRPRRSRWYRRGSGAGGRGRAPPPPPADGRRRRAAGGRAGAPARCRRGGRRRCGAGARTRSAPPPPARTSASPPSSRLEHAGAPGRLADRPPAPLLLHREALGGQLAERPLHLVDPQGPGQDVPFPEPLPQLFRCEPLAAAACRRSSARSAASPHPGQTARQLVRCSGSPGHPRSLASSRLPPGTTALGPRIPPA